MSEQSFWQLQLINYYSDIGTIEVDTYVRDVSFIALHNKSVFKNQFLLDGHSD